ncbi:MAG: thiamine pyrophosphate-dependent dehydrogenase E1 component subunit alpha [Deltaproteobacteria bacterium]|nr:thiamine pyrophosphate-dependent dehydrogenase E1 component subunit alpha [Deltaproteobacteria bacterium]
MTDPTTERSPKARFDSLSGSVDERLYSQMTLIRQFEERLLQLFEGGELFGTTHCCIGQEADAVGILNHLDERDIVFSNHRCHGHFLVYGDRPELLMAEMMGKAGGLVGGRGGSQHICYHGFHSNGVQGGIVPNAVGMAMAEKLKGTGGMAVVFLGDGTLGQGVVYEALNLASLWSAPVLFVIEDNQWAQSTPVEKELAGDMVARGRAFGIRSGEITSTDASEIYAHFADIVASVRETGRPRFEVVHTYRLCHHSKSDDKRPREQVEARRVGDPVPLLARRLDPSVVARLDAEAGRRVTEAEEHARSLPFPDPSTLEDSLVSAR